MKKKMSIDDLCRKCGKNIEYYDKLSDEDKEKVNTRLNEIDKQMQVDNIDILFDNIYDSITNFEDRDCSCCMFEYETEYGTRGCSIGMYEGTLGNGECKCTKNAFKELILKHIKRELAGGDKNGNN